MSSLLVKAGAGRVIVDVTPETAGWSHVGFAARRLAQGDVECLDTGAREMCVTVLVGEVDVTIGYSDQIRRYSALGSRGSVFDDAAPTAVYVPPRRSVTVIAKSPAEVAFSFAPAIGKLQERVIEAAQMTRSVRGRGSNTRYVCDILPESSPAEGLLVVEVLTPGGHSSSYPPHKHDSSSECETQLEETYYHQLNPAQGFAFQRVYTDDRSIDEALVIEHRDTVLVPRGYHPCVAPHGYDLYYLNTMAGPVRRWQFQNDPAHEWMLQAT